MKIKLPSAVISLLIGMLIPLVPNIGSSLTWFSLLFIFILAGLPSLLLSAIANYFLKKSGASDRSIMFASITIGIVLGSITFMLVLMAGGQ